MADEQNDQQQATDEARGFQPITSQEELNRIIAERVERTKRQFAGFSELKTKAAKYDEVVEASKSEQQKLIERAEAAERQAREYEVRSLRAEVAARKGVPASSLTGSTVEELEASADTLIAWRDEAAKSNTLNPRGGFYSGASAPKDAGNDPKSRAAAALRELHRQ